MILGSISARNDFFEPDCYFTHVSGAFYLDLSELDNPGFKPSNLDDISRGAPQCFRSRGGIPACQ